MKSDFQAAYRSCPILPDDIPYANILARDPSSGVVSVTAQWAMPFGAVSAVYAWDRLGEAITAILRKVCLFPASRYVDDLFMPIWVSISGASREILLEVVSIFGAVLNPAKTLPPSESMPVLGVLVSINSTGIELRIRRGGTLQVLAEGIRPHPRHQRDRKEGPRQSHGGAPRVRRPSSVGISPKGSLQRLLQDRLRGLPRLAPGRV